MQLAKFTDYALRILMHLSVAVDYSLTTRQIAQIHNAKFNHLAKVSQWLVKHGFVSALRGRGGGLRLAHSPEQINIGHIVRLLEGHNALVVCFNAQGDGCVLSSACGLKLAFNEAREAFYQVLDEKTLASLTPPKGQAEILLTRLNHQDVKSKLVAS